MSRILPLFERNIPWVIKGNLSGKLDMRRANSTRERLRFFTNQSERQRRQSVDIGKNWNAAEIFASD